MPTKLFYADSSASGLSRTSSRASAPEPIGVRLKASPCKTTPMPTAGLYVHVEAQWASIESISVHKLVAPSFPSERKAVVGQEDLKQSGRSLLRGCLMTGAKNLIQMGIQTGCALVLGVVLVCEMPYFLALKAAKCLPTGAARDHARAAFEATEYAAGIGPALLADYVSRNQRFHDALSAWLFWDIELPKKSP